MSRDQNPGQEATRRLWVASRASNQRIRRMLVRWGVPFMPPELIEELNGRDDEMRRIGGLEVEEGLAVPTLPAPRPRPTHDEDGLPITWPDEADTNPGILR